MCTHSDVAERYYCIGAHPTCEPKYLGDASACFASIHSLWLFTHRRCRALVGNDEGVLTRIHTLFLDSASQWICPRHGMCCCVYQRVRLVLHVHIEAGCRTHALKAERPCPEGSGFIPIHTPNLTKVKPSEWTRHAHIPTAIADACEARIAFSFLNEGGGFGLREGVEARGIKPEPTGFELRSSELDPAQMGKPM